MASESRQSVQFLTADGLQLSGYLYLGGGEEEKRPTIIMTPGVGVPQIKIHKPSSDSATKMPESIDPFLTDIASKFQTNAYTVLVYNNRNWYTSGGTPRNESDPPLQSRDYTAALNFCLGLPCCDPKKIVFWGGSLSGANAISAAAIDSRAAAVIGVVPTVSGEFVTQALGPMTKFILADSVNVTKGGASQMFPVGDTLKDVWGGCTGYGPYLDECTRRGVEWEGEATTQSMLHIQSSEPASVIHRVKGRVLMFIAEKDVVAPIEVQKEMFGRCQGKGNELYEVKGKGHFDLYYGEGLEEAMGVMLEFLRKLFG